MTQKQNFNVEEKIDVENKISLCSGDITNIIENIHYEYHIDIIYLGVADDTINVLCFSNNTELTEPPKVKRTEGIYIDNVVDNVEDELIGPNTKLI